MNTFRTILRQVLCEEVKVYDNVEEFTDYINDWLDGLEPMERVDLWNEFAKKGFYKFYLYDNDDEGKAKLVKDFGLTDEEAENAFVNTRSYKRWNNFVTKIDDTIVSTDNFEELFGYAPLVTCIVIDKFKVSSEYGFAPKITDEVRKEISKNVRFEVRY